MDSLIVSAKCQVARISELGTSAESKGIQILIKGYSDRLPLESHDGQRNKYSSLHVEAR